MFDLLLASDSRSARQTDLKIESVREIRVDGIQGFEGVCTACSTENNLRRLFYVAALFKSDAEFYRIWGLVRLSGRKRFEPQFKKMTRSFKLKRKPGRVKLHSTDHCPPLQRRKANPFREKQADPRVATMGGKATETIGGSWVRGRS